MSGAAPLRPDGVMAGVRGGAGERGAAPAGRSGAPRGRSSESEGGGGGAGAGRAWGDPSSGWLFHAPRRGTSSERFGIFRDSGRSADGPSSSDRHRRAAAGGKGRRHATRWAVLAAIAAMITLFVCLLLIDFTRSERAASRKTVNATSRSFAVDDEVGRTHQEQGVQDEGRDREHRHPDQERGGGGRRQRLWPERSPGRQGEGSTPTTASNHRYPYHFPYYHPHAYPRPRDYGRSLKGHADAPPSGPEQLAPDHAEEEEDDEEEEGEWEDGDQSGESVEEDEEDEEGEEYDEGASTPHYSVARTYRSLDGDTTGRGEHPPPGRTQGLAATGPGGKVYRERGVDDVFSERTQGLTTTGPGGKVYRERGVDDLLSERTQGLPQGYDQHVHPDNDRVSDPASGPEADGPTGQADNVQYENGEDTHHPGYQYSDGGAVHDPLKDAVMAEDMHRGSETRSSAVGSLPVEDAPSELTMMAEQNHGEDEVPEDDVADSSERALVPERLLAGPPGATPPSLSAEDRSDDGHPEDRSDNGHPEDAVALPYHSSQDPRSWPGMVVEDRDRERERWAELVHMHQQQQHQQHQQARRHYEAQRKNFYSELGTIQGEHYMLPHFPVVQQENLGPVLFPSSSSKQPQQGEAAQTHFVPKKLMKLMLSQQQGNRQGMNGKPWTFLQTQSSAQPSSAQPNPNQYLVVNNKGVVIPHSVNFPDIVKTANYPQLQGYRNQQSNRNVQDLINYIKGKGKRPYSWNGAALKKAALVSGMFGSPQQAQASSEYDMLTFPRPEPYVKEMASSAESGERPDSHYNGHAYIADPFHPYKPSDPTEINQMASSLDSDTSASAASSERMRHPAFVDEVGEPFAVSPMRPTFHMPGHGSGGRYGRLRHPFPHAGGAPQYTEATFKPLGSEIASASDTATPATVRAGPKSVPPLSVMLEIFPMGEAKTKEGAATVMWNNFPVAALRPVIKKPANPSAGLGQGLGQGLSASLASTLGMALQQAEASVRRPVTLPMDAAASSSASSSASTASRYPVLMQGQLSAGHGQPAFGVTLSGVQGLQNLAGMPMLDSKHRMVVHLNFYPKKTVNMPLRFRDLSGADQMGQGASLIAGGTFPQRRQSAVPDDTDAASVGSVAVDVAPLLQSLPPDMQRHLAAILQTYQQRPSGASLSRSPARFEDDEFDGGPGAGEDADEEYVDDNASAEQNTYARRQQQQQSMSSPPVDAEPSRDGSSSEEDADDGGIGPNTSPVAHWLLGRDKPWPSQSAPPPRQISFRPSTQGNKSPTASLSFTPKDRTRGSYFDVQDDVEDVLDQDESREGELSAEDLVVHKDESDAPKANKRILQDLETSLSPRERLLLWRHWKEMQALDRRAELTARERIRKRRRKNSLERTLSEDSMSDSEGVVSGERSTVPKNHRVD